VLQRPEVLARDTHGFTKARPGFDAAGVAVAAVVVLDAQQPAAARFTVRAIGQDRCIFLRDRNLVVETVGNPTPDLVRRETAFLHPHIEGMVDMVVLLVRHQLVDEGGLVPAWLEADLLS